ncbi:MAG: DNA topoisomerase VI subunit B [Candidatus Thermoplasmatota archaeon]|jgi:DNA topoisomerase-6 subunit B|nr:DNA topoisomerase VI subunit B [Candidatus Thermoplasmatota archaeon]MCL5794586.1 DNA topoisomerase VI subunit B [Candidatus Thermoplasmatota archaeon]
MVRKQPEVSVNREISISEFFEKNRHILGFDSAFKSLFMIVKEAIDNSLDACEEHGILPEIQVEIEKLQRDEFRITITDNGPGIDRKDVPNVFGKLLYGSRFHGMRQTRGQQGIGITAAVLYGQITTGQKSRVITKKKEDDVAYLFELGIDIKENRGQVFVEKPMIWDREHGTSVSITARGKYQTGRQSIVEYLKETAAVNPNMDLSFTDPEQKHFVLKRVIDIPSRRSTAVKPYPLGLELGEIQQIAKTTETMNLLDFLSQEFSRISRKTAGEIISISGMDEKGDPRSLAPEDIRKLMEAFRKVQIMAPPSDSLCPLGQEFIRKGLLNVYGDLHPSFYSKPVMRPPAVYNGNPFSVECGIVYGGDLPSDSQVTIIRYANKVPLLFQPGACAITRAVSETDWRSYGLEQRSGTGIPFGPMMVLVHVLGTRLPYTSESKEAIASVPEIVDEIKSALRIAGRSLKTYMNKKERRAKVMEKFRIVRELVPAIAAKSSSLLGQSEPDITSVISKIANVILVTETFAADDHGLTVTCQVYNYTTETAGITIIPDPPAGEISGTRKAWELSSIAPAGKAEFTFRLDGFQGKYDGTVYYFTGQDVTRVQGADPLPGDWDIRGPEIVEEEASGGN